MRALLSRLAILKKLHWVTWCALIVTIAVLVLIAVPGDQVNQYSYWNPEIQSAWHQQCIQLRDDTVEATYTKNPQLRHINMFASPGVDGTVYEHGWPLPFLGRVAISKYDFAAGRFPESSEPWISFKSPFTDWGGSLHYNVSWSDYDSWPFQLDNWIVRPWSLLWDAMVFFFLLAVVGGLVEWRVRRNQGIFRFHLADMIGVMTVISVVLGYYAYHRSIQQIEHFGKPYRFLPAFTTLDGKFNASVRYEGPRWLRKLVGHPYYPKFLNHVYSASIETDEDWREIYEQLPRFPYLSQLRIRGEFPLAAVEILEECPRLESLTLPNFDRESSPQTTTWGEPRFQLTDLHQLARLSLRSVKLSGSAISADQIEQIASLPTIQRIDLEAVSATPEEIEQIMAKYPDTTFLVMPDLQVFLSPG